MNREELEKLAHEAISLWADETKAILPGEPYIKVVNAQPMAPAFPIRWSCIAVQGKHYISFINAQDTLNYLAGLQRTEPKKVLPKIGVFK